MGRKKVKLAFIANNASRKAAYKKRKNGLFKKMDQLSILCDVDACVISYSPCNDSQQPEVWPNVTGVQHVVDQFKSMPEMEQSRRMMNQESFLRQHIAKTTEQLNKQIRENRQKEMTEVMYQCLARKSGVHNLMLSDLNDLGSLVEQKLTEISKRMNEMTLENSTPNQVPTTGAGDNMGVLATGVVEQQNSITDFNTHVANGGLVPSPSWFNEPVIDGNGAAIAQNSQGEETFMTSLEDANNTFWSGAFSP